MDITAAMIKELKEKSGAGMLDCKTTLVETNGDMEKSLEILRKKGLANAAKRADKEAKEGVVALKIEGKKGLVIKINCETDFVAKNDIFKKFVEDAVEVVFKKGTSAALPAELEDLRKEVISKLSENILVSEWKFIEAKGELTPYLHGDRFAVKIASIVDFTTTGSAPNADELKKNIAMQVTAMNPVAVDVSGVPAALVENLKKEFTDEAKATGKPEKVIENIVKGKFDKYYAESVLLEQAFISDEDKKVKDVIAEAAKQGLTLQVNGFVRTSL